MAPTGLSLVKRLPRAFSLERSSHMTPLPTFSLLPQNQGREAWRGDGCHCRHLGNCECEKDLKFVLWERLSLKFGEYDADACCNGAASSPGFFLFLLPSCPWLLPPHSSSYGQICVYLGLCELRMGHRQLQFKLHSSSTYNVPSSQFQPPLASHTTTTPLCQATLTRITSPRLALYQFEPVKTAVPGHFNPDRHSPRLALYQFEPV